MPKNSLNVSLKGADDIFSTEESRQEQQREQVQQIPIGELFPFKNHPFKVLDDESMQRTVESVEQYGVLSPLIARPRPEGGYEIISGHRRQHAAQLAGLDALPVMDKFEFHSKLYCCIGVTPFDLCINDLLVIITNQDIHFEIPPLHMGMLFITQHTALLLTSQLNFNIIEHYM